MILVAIICPLAASLISTLMLFFVKKSASFSLAFSLLNIISLLVACLACSNLNFSLYTIFIILSIGIESISVFLTFFSKKKTTEIEENYSQTQQISEINEKTPLFWLKISNSLVSLISAVSLAFCGFILGKETIFGFIAGVCLGFLLTFINAIFDKNLKNITKKTLILTLVERLFLLVSAGLLLSQIVVTLAYSFNLKNILFSIATLLLGAYTVLQVFRPNKYNIIMGEIGVFTLVITLLF